MIVSHIMPWTAADQLKFWIAQKFDRIGKYCVTVVFQMFEQCNN